MLVHQMQHIHLPMQTQSKQLPDELCWALGIGSGSEPLGRLPRQNTLVKLRSRLRPFDFPHPRGGHPDIILTSS